MYGGREQLESIRLCSKYDFEQASASQLKLDVLTDYLLTRHFWFLSHTIFNAPPLFPELIHYLCI